MTDAGYQWRLIRADLDPVTGSEQGGMRPVLVVSRESINSALPIVGVLPLTTYKPGRRIYSTEVLLPAGAAGQPADSIVMAHQVRTISTTRLGEPYGELTDSGLRDAVRRAMRVYLDLDT
jgi:mRNA interferase MazF